MYFGHFVCVVSQKNIFESLLKIYPKCNNANKILYNVNRTGVNFCNSQIKHSQLYIIICNIIKLNIKNIESNYIKVKEENENKNCVFIKKINDLK